MTETRQQAERARKAFLKLSTSADRTAILNDVANAIRENAGRISAANEKDLAEAKGSLAEPLYKRLILHELKLRDVISGITQIAKMEDPVGHVLEETELDEDLILRKVRTPIDLRIPPGCRAADCRTGDSNRQCCASERRKRSRAHQRRAWRDHS
jgi:glutamate-5-semialdehyde dehydrogenase